MVEWLEGVQLGWVALVASAVAALLTLNAYFPVKSPSLPAAISFFAGWLICELAAHHLIFQFGVAGLFVYFGALDHWSGWAALALSVASWASLTRLHQRGQLASGVATAALQDGLDEPMTDGLDRPVRLRNVVSSFSTRRRDVERLKDIEFVEIDGKRLKLDIHRPVDQKEGAPVLLFFHGGAWVIGFKEFQGQPMFSRMASQGWVCVNADYRLSPRASFPDHIADVKRAIAWVKEHIAEYGGDPGFIVTTGNSAGGHLASLAALTWDVNEFQPGFEGVDTKVQACVSFYGVYDLLDRFGHWPRKSVTRFFERVVIKKKLEHAEALFRLGSPIDQIRPDAPPFMLVHGAGDSVVPVQEARRFHAALKEKSTQPVVYLEIPDAQHAFEIFRSVRGHHTLRATANFLQNIHAQHIKAQKIEEGVECTG